MTDPNYILCRWKKRFWPAKILCRTGGSRGTLRNRDLGSLNVEILVAEEQINVKNTDIKPLDKSQVENIANELESKSKMSDSAVKEELTYRNALRIAMNILNRDTPPDMNSSEQIVRIPAKGTKRNTDQKSQLCSHTSALQDSELPESEPEEEKKKRRSSRLAACQTETQAADHILVKRKVKTNRKLAKSLKSNAACLPALCKVRSMMEERLPSASVTQERIGSKKLQDCCSAARFPEPSLGCIAQNMMEEKVPVSEFCYTATSTPARERSGRCPPEKLLDFFPGNASVELACDLRSANSVRAWSCKKDFAVVNKSAASECVNCVETEESLVRLQDRKPERCQKGLKLFASDYHENTSISSLEPHSESDMEGKSYSRNIARKHQLPDFEEMGEFLSSDLSMEFSMTETPPCSSTWVDEDKEEDEELPSVLLQQEPLSVETGTLVWCKFQKYPYWPAVVKNVKRKRKKASILFIEESLSDPTKKKQSFSVSLRALKHFDCEEKQKLMDKARENYARAIDWCITLISDYRIRVGCHSFAGTFVEYCYADISKPVRKEVDQGPFRITFPVLEREVKEESQSMITPTKRQLSKKMLPDRARAARDKANEKLVDYIVKNNKVEKHLLAVMKGKKKSRWLQDFLNPSQCLTCIETYLEDEGQCEKVVAYLKTVCDQMSSSMETLKNGDHTRFTLDVLLPEAVICAISAVDEITYKKAEEKYMKGPSVSKREREIFEKQILEEKKSRELLEMEADPGEAEDGH
ncbi:PWWP domain-containing DNA repair factor 3A [Rhinatrema bivittatum]|uniref:PWWP domain-containing DNA repair factor 3A n=1 Tax=Rhinatrema bivittatum TaxID=194408 RepID=UPI00112A4770|nr:PWWP domain-containing DNA repair factor 3A [Rhinatrema bivittatum]XP_029469089.1 PWWP domain-containing DNA repair factor 3A [Rhinatrema bivittatum]XP_029469090.1 PWWP domain-containing DNA repair factor 3A [Rhinatrema bivittatum]